MNNNLTEIVLVLDESGSMSVVKDVTIKAVNDFMMEQMSAPGEANITLVKFNSAYKPQKRIPVAQWKPIDREDYNPSSNTALFDAVGRAIEELGRVLEATPEDKRPGKVVFVIQTDGLENASTDFDAGKIKSMIDHQRSTYGWQFVYLGANQDAIAQGTKFGILRDNAMTYTSTPESVSMTFGTASTMLRAYRSTGDAVSLYWTSPDNPAGLFRDNKPQ